MITLRFKTPTQHTSPVSLPGSKSMAARALIINALAEEPASLAGLPQCEDTSALRQALDLIADGNTPKLDIGAAGTAMRFMTALCAATPGLYVLLTGTERMCRRPIKPIVDALIQAGADINYQRHNGYPPLLIKGKQLHAPDIDIRADVSSQFISGLMMIAPNCKDGLTIHRTGARTVSRPYIRMTAKMMRDFGVEVIEEGTDIRIPQAKYSAPENYQIEPDWSAASYFYEIAALLDGTPVKINALRRADESVQGDARCEELFRNLGVSTQYLDDGSAILTGGGLKSPADVDLSETPDLVPALALAHCLCGVPFQFKGIDHLRLKECDRLDVIVKELRKLGFIAETHDDILLWNGHTENPHLDDPIRTHDDHRIAMAFAPAVLRFGEITILHEAVVDKSFPRYWENLERLGIQIYY